MRCQADDTANSGVRDSARYLAGITPGLLQRMNVLRRIPRALGT